MIAAWRLVEVLECVEATGYSTHEIDLRDPGRGPVPGCVGFRTTSGSDDTDVRHPYDDPTFCFGADGPVVAALKAAEMDVKYQRVT